MSLAISTHNLTKTYKSRAGSVDVVKNLDLEVGEGEIFAFLGPNGAGKTTTIKMLLGIIYQTSGEAQVLGKDPGDLAAHRLISYLPEKPYYYEHMTGIEIMMFYASLFGIRDRGLCEQLLKRVNLSGDMNRQINQYSKGMQQRIGLAQSLLNDPKVLFLDEPTGGLDPIAHIEIRDLILKFREEGRTVFISSHELSDVERICDRVAIINKGEMVHQGKLDHLLAGGRIEITADDVSQEVADQLRADDVIVSFAKERLIIDMPDSSNPNEVIDSLRTAGSHVVSIIPRRKRLEDLFIESVSGDNLAKGRNLSKMTDDGSEESGEVKA